MSLINKVFFIFLIYAAGITTASAQTEVLPNLNDNQANTVILNDQLRQTSRRLLALEGGIDINTRTTGILTVDRGGTGKDLSAKTTGSLIYFSGTGVMNTIGIGTTGYFLQATGGTPPVGWAQALAPYTAGDYLTAGPSVIKAVGVTSYAKKIEMRLPRSGTLRIKFGGASNNGGGTFRGRIYRNGVAVGTVRSFNQSDDWVEYSEDIAGWTAGDLLQLYAESDNNTWESNCWVGGLRIYEGAPPYEDFTSGSGYHQNIWNGTMNIDPHAANVDDLGAIGDLYIENQTGGVGTTLYVKEAAATWTAK